MAQPLWLRIEGARQNNLKNVTLAIPHDRVTVVTGVSGSGKSSLAFDTIFAEGLAAEIPGPHARFDANMDAHHHFTCVRCGRIVDIDGPLAEPQAEALRVRIAARTGLAITHHRIEFFGRCPQCRSAKARPHRSPQVVPTV